MRAAGRAVRGRRYDASTCSYVKKTNAPNAQSFRPLHEMMRYPHLRSPYDRHVGIVCRRIRDGGL
jgi:hypothetical protein